MGATPAGSCSGGTPAKEGRREHPRACCWHADRGAVRHRVALLALPQRLCVALRMQSTGAKAPSNPPFSDPAAPPPPRPHPTHRAAACR
jgi:hypothetical protein